MPLEAPSNYPSKFPSQVSVLQLQASWYCHLQQLQHLQRSLISATSLILVSSGDMTVATDLFRFVLPVKRMAGTVYSTSGGHSTQLGNIVGWTQYFLLSHRGTRRTCSIQTPGQLCRAACRDKGHVPSASGLTDPLD